jgi:hypothetical protein
MELMLVQKREPGTQIRAVALECKWSTSSVEPLFYSHTLRGPYIVERYSTYKNSAERTVKQGKESENKETRRLSRSIFHPIITTTRPKNHFFHSTAVGPNSSSTTSHVVQISWCSWDLKQTPSNRRHRSIFSHGGTSVAKTRDTSWLLQIQMATGCDRMTQ